MLFVLAKLYACWDGRTGKFENKTNMTFMKDPVALLEPSIVSSFRIVESLFRTAVEVLWVWT